MGFSIDNWLWENIKDKMTELQILSFYFNVPKMPLRIKSPFRKEEHPSFSIFSPDGIKIYYKDFGTGDSGGLLDFLKNLFYYNSIEAVKKRIISDFYGLSTRYTDCKKKTEEKEENTCSSNYRRSIYGEKLVLTNEILTVPVRTSKSVNLKCVKREWRDYDIEFWKDFGIEKKWLVYAEVYPISHIIMDKDGILIPRVADKHAYAYIEHKENNTTLKIYQPFNKHGFKWQSKHDGSVISLWTKIPKTGKIICICSSLKDALCLWSNTGIPSIALQGEGYDISKTAQNELKKRFEKICILFDNDKSGIRYAEALSKSTGFIQIPPPEGAKDIADLYKKIKDKKTFKEIMTGQFKKVLG